MHPKLETSVRAIAPQTEEVKELREALEEMTRQRNLYRGELEGVVDQLPRLRQMIEHSTDIMLLVDDQGGICDCNRAATEELGYPRDGLHGRTIHELWVGDVSSLVAGLEQAQPGQHTILTGDLIRRDGQRLPIEAHISAFTAQEKRYRVVVARNVSDRQELELALRHIQKQLAFVRERQAMEQNLQKTNRLEALGGLAGGIAHDFNNIFAVIRANVEILPELSPAEQAEAAADATEALQQAASMAHQLLTFSRGGSVIRKQANCKEWLSSSSRLAMSGSIHELVLAVEPDLPFVEIDQGQMTQVLHNLIKNAQEAMPRSGKITIRASRISAPEDRVSVRIVVEDEGPGICADLATRVFDPFFTTKEEGNGIGLATSHKIVREHEGTLRVLAERDHGAFELMLPGLPNMPPASSPNMSPASHSSAGRPFGDSATTSLQGLRILLMDDEASVRSVIARTLRIAGAKVDECARGEEAIDLFRQSLRAGPQYDAAVLDLVIRKGIGGIETMAALRELDPEIKAVVCSGHSDDAVRDRFRSLGFRSYVAKPFSTAELVGVIADVARTRS